LRVPFRLFSARALRQAVLRASFRLAPWLATRPCDLPADKTRDASHRRLPPVRTACTRTSRVPGPLSRLTSRGHPTESWAPCGIAGGRGVSRHPQPLWRIVPKHYRVHLPASLRAVTSRWSPAASVGVLVPRCLESSIVPLTSLSLSLFRRVLESLSRSFRSCELALS
jgi:hypothetical protein